MIIKSDQDTIKNYFEDSSNLKGGWAQKVVIPENIDDISSFLHEANAKKIPVTISGGGTATTGSRISFGGVVLSTEKLNKIIEVSSVKMSATVEAGVLVEELKCAAENKGLFYTSHPTEKAASVGGTIATNASGSRSFRYGPTRKYVKRLKMVLPDGEIFEIVRGQKFLTKKNPHVELPSGRVIRFPAPNYTMPPVKSSAGYFWKDGMDLIDLFIAQEGTLSVIVQIELGLVKKPGSIASYFVFFKTEEDSWDFSQEIKSLEDSNVLSIEYFDRNAVDLLRLKNRNIPADAVSAIFFEQEVGRAGDDVAVESWIKMITAHNGSPDSTWAAMGEKDSQNFTQLRYAIPESINDIIRQSGFRKFSTDIAVPADKFRKMMNFYIDTFKNSKLRHVMFGHIGENHLHVNILPMSADEINCAQDLSMQFIKKAVSLGGTVSAEHGIGKLKHKYLQEMFGEQGIKEMVEIKKAFDPNCILGLDNIFAKEILA